MATSSTFYLNAPSLGSATAAFLDGNLSVCAPDGFYSDGVTVREQVDCVLLPQQTCPACAVPCGSPINGSGNQGAYLVNLDTGNSIGAVIIRFNPYGIPDGIKATYNGLVYNKLTSPVDGLHQSSNASNFTFIGNTGDDCGISGTTYPALQEFLYSGTAFIATGNTQSVTVAAGDVSLSATDPGNCMMVIPKSAASPSIINFEMIGPCSGTAFLITIACPVLLTGFSSSSVFGSAVLACAAAETQTYYNASLDNTPGIVDVFDFVYSDNVGVSPLANGFYNATGSITGGAQWFQVASGVVIAVGSCAVPFSSTSVQTTFELACGAALNQTYYAFTATINTGSAVYSNIGLTTALPNGFYSSNNIAGGASWFQVTSGVITATGSCPLPVTGLNWATTVDNTCDAAPWVISNQNLRIRYNVTDSVNCGGTCGAIQSGTATATITVGGLDVNMGLSFTGVGEREASAYEKILFRLDGVQIANANAPGGGLECQMGAVVQTFQTPPPYLLLAGSVHTLFIDFTTADALYHVNSFYEVDLTFTEIP